jgi:hypothetical protein
MRFRMLPTVRIALALSVLLLAACGSTSHGTSKAGYESRMSAIEPSLQSDLLKGRFALENIRVPAVARRQLQLLEHRLRTSIAGLRAITPPDDVASQHAGLIEAYQALLSDFKSLDALTRGRTTDKLRVHAGELANAPPLHEVGRELEAIIAKGYDLGFPKGS